MTEEKDKYTEDYRESLIKTFEWYRDNYHKEDFGHTECIEAIKTCKASELEAYEAILDFWLE